MASGLRGSSMFQAGTCGLVGDEEVVHMPGYEPGAGGLPQHDVNDVLAVEVAGVSEEGLLCVVVVFGPEAELPRVASVRIPGHLGVNRPSGEGAGALEYVRLGVVSDAEAEQFQKLASPVLVGSALVVLVIVQPVDHGGVSGEFDQKLAVVAHAVVSEHIYLFEQVVAVVHLGVSGGEDVVPEQRHLLLQRSLGGDHPVEPVGLARRRRSARHLGDRVVSVQRVLIHRGLRLGVEEFFYGCLVTYLAVALHFLSGRSEPGATHEVGY